MRFNPKLRAGLNQARREMIKENRILNWNTSIKQGDYGKVILKLIDCYYELKGSEIREKDLRNKVWCREVNVRRLSKLLIKYQGELRLLKKRFKLCEKQKKMAREKLKHGSNLSYIQRKYKLVNGKRVKV